MSFSETIFLFFLALIIFGPKKLPEIARTVGKALNEFRRASNEFKAQIEQEIAHLEVENQQKILPPSPPPQGTASRTLTAVASEPAPATPPSETPSTPASSDDEPLFALAATEPEAAPSSAVVEAAPESSAVAPSTTQGSHV